MGSVTVSRSARLDVVAECSSDHFGHGYASGPGAAEEKLFISGVETNRFDG